VHGGAESKSFLPAKKELTFERPVFAEKERNFIFVKKREDRKGKEGRNRQ